MKPIGRPRWRMKKSEVGSVSSPTILRRYFSSSSSGYSARGGSCHHRLTCGSRSQRRTSGRSASVSSGKSYSGSGVLGEAKPRERLGLRNAVVGPTAGPGIGADLLGDVVRVEAHAREHARDVRLHRLLGQLVVGGA